MLLTSNSPILCALVSDQTRFVELISLLFYDVRVAYAISQRHNRGLGTLMCNQPQQPCAQRASHGPRTRDPRITMVPNRCFSNRPSCIIYKPHCLKNIVCFVWGRYLQDRLEIKVPILSIWWVRGAPLPCQTRRDESLPLIAILFMRNPYISIL